MHLTKWNVPSLLLAASVVSALFAPGTTAAAADHWVGTWTTAPMAVENTKNAYAEDTTLHEIVHVSLGGDSVRVVLSNAFGTDALKVGGANIALAGAEGAASGASVPLQFNGQSTIEVPVGAEVVSDPVSLKVAALSDLDVNIFLPGQTIATLTQHNGAYQTNYVLSGNQLASTSLTEAKKLRSWPFLKSVEVMAPANSAAIVCFGDSITDGAHSTPDKNMRWPDELARRLQAGKKTSHLSVLNVGIGGNRLLHDKTGPNALARFDRDVLDQSGVKYLIILEGINDIGHSFAPKKRYDAITADDLKGALTQLIERAHAHGIKVFGATLTPYVGAGYESPEGETAREAENDFILHSGKFDGVVDFAKATADPADATRFAAAAASTDHLHPGDAGYKIMGDSIDLGLFKK